MRINVFPELAKEFYQQQTQTTAVTIPTEYVKHVCSWTFWSDPSVPGRRKHQYP
jgi:hypothetical protein